MPKDYTPLIGLSVYDFFRYGKEERKITNVNTPAALYPICVEVTTYTTTGKANAKNVHGTLSTTPYNPLTGEGVYTPFDADKLLAEIEQEKVAVNKYDLLGKLCVFSEVPITNLHNNPCIGILHNIYGTISGSQYAYVCSNIHDFWDYCRPLTDFDLETGELKNLETC